MWAVAQERGDPKNRPYGFEAAAYSVQDQISAPMLLEKSLERTAREVKYLEVYWTSLLPHGQAFPPQAARYSTTRWTSAIQDLYHKDPLVRVVLLANALTRTAQRIEDPSLMVQGRRLYGLSLQAVARSLLDKKRQDSGRILAASGLLTSYELLLNDDQRHSWLPAPAWLRHTSGEMAIILAGGPENFIHGSAHQLFVDYRLHLIYPYIQSRRHCPLSSLEWTNIPWSIHPKSPKDKLVDILIEVPGILEDMTILKTLSSQPQERYLLCQALEERCWRCDRQLLIWSTSCGNAIVDFVESLISVQDLSENSAESAPPSTYLAMAHLGMLYWTTYNLLSQILSWLRQAAPSKNKTPPLPPRMDAHLYVHKVALLIPYFNKPEVGSYLISFIGFPVAVAASFLAREDSAGTYSEARALLVQAFSGGERGKELQRFLASWPWLTRSEADTLGMTGAQATVN
ncbi:hypothetical protein H2200_008203 [Cladophialophora chaetospira]|uniref:Uncharacterized protein n=1 Tax=Cladophialophora chaetospira TaxID=386627 RepID=A0AA38X5T2_9EURO|nr:hypothetical protein H2200_008203 [Cladophialophora chaetospira]